LLGLHQRTTPKLLGRHEEIVVEPAALSKVRQSDSGRTWRRRLGPVREYSAAAGVVLSDQHEASRRAAPARIECDRVDPGAEPAQVQFYRAVAVHNPP